MRAEARHYFPWWQRDVAVSHFKLYQFANKSGDEVMAGRERGQESSHAL